MTTSMFLGYPAGAVAAKGGHVLCRRQEPSAAGGPVGTDNIKLPRGQTIQLRADVLTAPNAAGFTGRMTTMNLSSPSDPSTITNLPYDANGQLIQDRSLAAGAGFGVANNYRAPRNVQLQIRYSF
jgi:hypothetical protein